MPGISKIPDNINKYAIEWARRICKEPIENGIGFDFMCRDTFLDRVLQESPVYKGTEHKLGNFDFEREPHDIFIHNHPVDLPLSLDDVFVAVEKKIKKIFASTNFGFTSLDFTPIIECKEVSRNTMEQWAYHKSREANKYVDELNHISEMEQNPKEKPWVIMGNHIKCYDYLTSMLEEFANFSGAIFEKVDWWELK